MNICFSITMIWLAEMKYLKDYILGIDLTVQGKKKYLMQ